MVEKYTRVITCLNEQLLVVKNVPGELMYENRGLEDSEECVAVQMNGFKKLELTIKNQEMRLFTKGFLGVVSTLYIIQIA